MAGGIAFSKSLSMVLSGGLQDSVVEDDQVSRSSLLAAVWV